MNSPPLVSKQNEKKTTTTARCVTFALLPCHFRSGFLGSFRGGPFPKGEGRMKSDPQPAFDPVGFYLVWRAARFTGSPQLLSRW